VEHAKEAVRRLLDELPDEVTLEDIQYHIYVQQAVQQGLDAANSGELVDQEEIEQRMAKWLGA
jgi:predicted transcriptional regulator